MKSTRTLFLAALLLLSLTACRPSVTGPSAPVDPAPNSAAPTEAEVSAPADDGHYLFVAGHFMGSWSDGQWHSAHNTDFTLGQVLNRNYYNSDGDFVRAARFSVAWDSGLFPENAEALLEPFGIIEGYDFVLSMPARFSGEAAQLPVPRYNFNVALDGQYGLAMSGAQPVSPFPDFPDTHLPDGEVLKALSDLGVYCDLSRMDRITLGYDLDGDGRLETLELIQPLRDEGGYPVLEPGDSIFYALLLSDEDGVSVVASELIDYTDDVTAYFHASLNTVTDVNGDGSLEIALHVTYWEWGRVALFSREDGQWSEVLRAEYGM